MESDIYSILTTKYNPEQLLKRRKVISTGEKGVKYLAYIIPERETAIFQVDGEIIVEGDKCDKLVLSKNTDNERTWSAHFIELKGSDVEHAIKQIETTMKNPLFMHPTLTKRAARIVAKKFPVFVGNSINFMKFALAKNNR